MACLNAEQIQWDKDDNLENYFSRCDSQWQDPRPSDSIEHPRVTVESHAWWSEYRIKRKIKMGSPTSEEK